MIIRNNEQTNAIRKHSTLLRCRR